MTGAAKWALLVLVLMQAVQYSSSGYSTTVSYDELLAAVKSGKFTVEKADNGKVNSQDLLQEILDKSKSCFITIRPSLPRLGGGNTVKLKQKHIKHKNILLLFLYHP